MVFVEKETCPNCRGSGKRYGAECFRCNGTGYIKKVKREIPIEW